MRCPVPKNIVKAKGKNLKIELEVRNFDELNQALAEGVDRIMFDNLHLKILVRL